MFCSSYWFLFAYMLFWNFNVYPAVDEITDSEHRTKGATERVPDLWCYRCDTMVDGERCSTLKDNNTFYHNKCNNEERTCEVKRISMSTITSTGEIPGKAKLWLLQRNCTKSCEPGCIVIGERTKLYSCVTCCESSFCNTGSSARSYLASIHYKRDGVMFILLTAVAGVFLVSVFLSDVEQD